MLLKFSPERPYQEPPQVLPENINWLRSEVKDYLPSTVKTKRGAAIKTGQVPSLDGPPIIKRDTFKDILADAVADMAKSTPVISERPTDCQVEQTPQIGASQVPLYHQGLFINPEPQKDLFEEGIGHSFLVAATEFRKLREPKVAKLKGGYSSKPALSFYCG